MPDQNEQQTANQVQETQVTQETTQTTHTRNTRTRAATPAVRSLEDLQNVDAKKMSDQECVKVINDLRGKNQLLDNKLQELTVSYRKCNEELHKLDDAFNAFIVEHNAKMQYALDVVRLSYQNLKLASKNQVNG